MYTRLPVVLLVAVLGQSAVPEIRSDLLDVELDDTSEEIFGERFFLEETKYQGDRTHRSETAPARVDPIGIVVPIDRRSQHRPARQMPRILYQIGESEEDLPECSDRREVCSKVDLYGSPWVERQCRCPSGRDCPGGIRQDDGHTIVDKTRQYKLCEPVKRLPVCRYFKDITWTLAPGGGADNATVQRVYCRCRPGSVPYLVRRQLRRSSEDGQGFVYAFACSPQSRLRCRRKEPCRLFTVRKRRSSRDRLEEVNASPLCQCPRGHRCPRRHTDPGSLPARSYSGVLEIKTYSGYCLPVPSPSPSPSPSPGHRPHPLSSLYAS